MDDSEGRRTNLRTLLPNLKFDPSTPLLTDSKPVYAYIASVGLLILNDEAVALTSVPARHRRVRHMTEEEVIEDVRKYLVGRWQDIDPNLGPPHTVDELRAKQEFG